MDNKECEVCTKMVKEKYKHYKTWKYLAIVFICLTVLFAILYFASGDLMSSTTLEYNNDVSIENGGSNNTNNDNGNIIVEEKDDNTAIVVILVILGIGGIIGGCYIVSQVSHNHKQQSDDKK